MNSTDKELKQKLYYHEKLIGMMGEKTLPIKSILLKDVQDMRDILEKAKREENTHDRNKK